MFLGVAENPVEYELEHFEALKEQSQKQLKKSVANVESTIFEKYFKKKFEKMMKSNYISNEDFNLFNKLSEAMSTDVNDDKMRKYMSYQFLREFENLSNERFEDIRDKANRYYGQGELTFDNFFKTIIETIAIGEQELNTIVGDMAGMLYPEQKLDFTMLFTYLLDNQQLCAAKHYSLLYVCKDGQNLPIIMKDGKPQCSWRLYKAKQLQENEQTEDFIDITISMDEDYKNIINDFDRLKNKVLGIDPKATITIVDTAIFTQYQNGTQKVYLINNGRIVPPDKTKLIPVQFQEDRGIMIPKNKAKAFRAKQKVETPFVEGKKYPKQQNKVRNKDEMKR